MPDTKDPSIVVLKNAGSWEFSWRTIRHTLKSMILSAFTLFHVLLSLLGIGAGIVVFYGLLTSKRFNFWISLFLVTTIATSVTGFFFPFHGITPGHVFGVLTLIAMAIAVAARYRYGLAGRWRRAYAVSSVFSLYLNVFVLIVQMFQKVPALRELAPTQSEPPFQMTQLAVLVIFLALGTRATMKFRSEPLPTA